MTKQSKNPQNNIEKRKKLTSKQQRFVEEYLIDLNATQAAKRAGYSKNRASEIGHQLLQKTTVREAIDAAKLERAARQEIKQDYVLQNLKEIVERTMQRAPVCNSKGEQLQDENGNNLWVFDAKGANKALELLGKHLGLFQGNGTGRPATHREILESFSKGELSVLEAAIEFEMNGLPLPETIRIQLQKEQPEPEDPTKGQYSAISDEEMEERYQKRLAQINAQMDGLPERQKEMQELRRNVGDKFAPGAKPEKVNEDEQ